MRFSVRGLLIGVTVVAAVLGGISSLILRPQFGDQTYNSVNRLTYSPDGTKLVVSIFQARDAGVFGKCYVANVSRYVALFDTATLNVSATVQHQYLPGNRGPFLLAPPANPHFSADGKLLEVSNWDDGRIRTWDTALNKWTGSSSPAPAYLSFTSPDGTTEVVTVQNDLELRDKQSGRLLLTLSDHRGWPVFSSDGKRLVINTKKGIEVWDLDTKQLVRRFHENKDELDRVSCLALSPDNHTLVMRCNEGLHIYHLDTGKEQVLISECIEVIRSATGWGTKGRTGDSTFGIEFTKDGQHLYAWGEYGLKVFDMSQSRKLIRSDPTLRLSCLTFSPDGKTYATGDTKGNVTLWDTATGNKIRSCEIHYTGGNAPVSVSVHL